MAMCKTIFQINENDNVEQLLSTFTQEKFANGRSAYVLSDGSYSIGAGENNTRAIYDDEKGVIQFTYRYQKDLPFYEKKLKSFANKHSIKTNTHKPVRP